MTRRVEKGSALRLKTSFAWSPCRAPSAASQPRDTRIRVASSSSSSVAEKDCGVIEDVGVVFWVLSSDGLATIKKVVRDLNLLDNQERGF